MYFSLNLSSCDSVKFKNEASTHFPTAWNMKTNRFHSKMATNQSCPHQPMRDRVPLYQHARNPTCCHQNSKSELEVSLNVKPCSGTQWNNVSYQRQITSFWHSGHCVQMVPDIICSVVYAKTNIRMCYKFLISGGLNKDKITLTCNLQINLQTL